MELGAVAEVEPLPVTYNAKGEVEGVKYDRIAVVLLYAVKEQQADNEEQLKQLRDCERQVRLQQELVVFKQWY